MMQEEDIVLHYKSTTNLSFFNIFLSTITKKMLIKTLNFYRYTQLLKKSKEIQIFIFTVAITIETCVKKKSTVSITVEIDVKKIIK